MGCHALLQGIFLTQGSNPSLLHCRRTLHPLSQLTGDGVAISSDEQGASLVAQVVKYPSAMQETWVRSLGQENPLEEGLATHCNILAWRIPWTEEAGELQSMGLQRVGHD